MSNRFTFAMAYDVVATHLYEDKAARMLLSRNHKDLKQAVIDFTQACVEKHMHTDNGAAKPIHHLHYRLTKEKLAPLTNAVQQAFIADRIEPDEKICLGIARAIAIEVHHVVDDRFEALAEELAHQQKRHRIHTERLENLGKITSAMDVARPLDR